MVPIIFDDIGYAQSITSVKADKLININLICDAWVICMKYIDSQNQSNHTNRDKHNDNSLSHYDPPYNAKAGFPCHTLLMSPTLPILK